MDVSIGIDGGARAGRCAFECRSGGGSPCGLLLRRPTGRSLELSVGSKLQEGKHLGLADP